MKRIQQMLCIAALTLTAGGCESPASSQDNAIEAQQEADKARAEAEREAAEKVAAAQAEANAAAAEAREEAQRTIENSQGEAAEARGEAGQDLVKARNDLREWSRTKLESIDRSLERARADARNLAPQARSNFDSVMKDAEAKRAAIQQDLSTLDNRAAAEWETFKTNFEARVDALEERLKDARARL